MKNRIVALVFIFICTTFAWAILGGVTEFRTYEQDGNLRAAVGHLWGTPQQQQAPQAHNAELVGSHIDVNLKLDHRKKGLLWYSTYRVEFDGEYVIENTGETEKACFFEYTFPSAEGIYDNFRLKIGDEEVADLKPRDGKISPSFTLQPGQVEIVSISYGSQGTDEWWYIFGTNISQVRDFSLNMITDFDDIDFPENGISPVMKKKIENGWELSWEYSNLISGIQIGMTMPQKLNPGPFAGRVTLFAPVSLFLFMFLIFIITTVRNINIHPMNYFFVAASFFAFHLLLAYLVDHIEVHLALVVCSIVSIVLVISYMRLVVGSRFAFVEVGLAQFVYLVLFSYAFLLEGYTGLSITICCILTLFVVMQYTARVDWTAQFAAIGSKSQRGGGQPLPAQPGQK
jgi:hypothetical protein